MTYLLLQTFLLLLSSYFFGALVACLAKRAMQTASAGLPATSSTATAVPVKARDTAPVIPVAPRAFDPVQPKIDVLSRPEPKAAPPIADTSRFDRALGTALTASANVPRKSVVEIRPAVLKSPTGPAVIPAARTAPAAPVKPTPAPPAQTPKAAPAPPVQPPRPAATITPPAPPKPPVPVPAQAAPQPAPQQQSVPQAAASAAAAAAAAVAAAKAAAAAVTPVKTSPPPQPAPPPAATVTVAPAAPPKPAPAAPPAAPAASPPPAAAKPSTAALAGDDFQRIRAIDEDTERRLKSGGVTRFEDMARWTPTDVQKINQALDLNGRIDREQWVEQAQILAKGGETYYSRNRSQIPRSGDAAPDQPMRPATPAAPAASPTPSAPASAAQSVPQMSVPQMSTSSSATQAAAAAAAAAATIRSNQPAPPAAPPPAPATAAPSASSAPAKPAPESPAKAVPAPGAPASPPQRSVSEMASAAAIAIAAASASVTRGMRPIEPISPLSKVDPNQSRPARLQDAIKEQETKAPSSSGPAFPLSGAAAPSVGRDFNHLRSVRSESLRSADFDDLKRIRGIGVLIEKRLNTLGVTSYNQIANWTNADIDRVSQTLDFKGRIERENWVEQARILSSGGHTEFSRRVDRGDVDSSRDS